MGIEPVPLVSIELKLVVSDSSKHRAARDKSNGKFEYICDSPWRLPDDA